MSEKKFDPTKPVQTRDGRAARIICVDHKMIATNPKPIIALVDNGSRGEMVYHYYHDGRDTSQHCSGIDLVNVPTKVKRELWLNIYGDAYGPAVAHTNRKQADSDAGPNRVACIPITIEYEKGEGL